MDEFVLKLIQQLGISGLSVYLLYRLLDRYLVKFLEHMGKFVEINATQAASIATIAESTGKSLDEQRDVAMALRVMSRQLEQVTGRLKELEALLGHK